VDPDDDNDGDPDVTDCAPLNPAIHHGAVEICNNGIDENCDGYADNRPGQPNATCNVCGDGWIDNLESCDHGNVSPGTGCATDCRSIVCASEPDSWLTLLSGSTCFWRVTNTYNRSTAADRCGQRRGFLVRMESAGERTWVFNNLVFPPGSGSRVWIGAQQCGATWCWDGGQVVGAEFVWNPGEPSGNGPCVQSSGNGERYDDLACDSSRDYVCERPRLGTPR
jgi:cysteine-rich repeat protein